MEHVILVNPVSGNHKGKKHGIIVQKLLAKYGINAKIFISDYPGNLTSISKSLSQNSTCRFYVIGGDGTLNEVVCGIINTNSEIVVVPCGTGNDFLKSISKYKSTRKIILESINKKSSKVDLLKINKDKYCINILNAGFDAMVAKNVDNFRIFRFLNGKTKYNLSIFYTLLSNRNYKFKIRDNKNNILKGSFTLIAVSNGKYYGGGICPCPKAEVSDGIINTCVVDSTLIKDKILLLPRYKNGTHSNLKKVHFIDSKKVTIVSTKKFPISLDGEIFYSNKLSISIIKNAINIVKT